MADGFIKLSRALLDWDWHNEVKTFCLYVHMLMLANHEETRWRGETLRRGQLLAGRKQLSVMTGLSEQEVRTALERLKKTGDVQIAAKSKYSIITLTKYDEHCSVTSTSTNDQPAHQPENNQQITSNQPAANQQPTTSKNLENVKNLRKAADDAPAREGKTVYNTPDMAAIEDMWQRMGNRVTANDIFRFEQAIASGHSVGDILDAMKEADEHGARESWAYVKTVLENWRVNGRREKPSKKDDQEDYDPYAGLPVFGSWDS